MAKQQFNVNLPPTVVRRTKHRAIDDQLSLSDWVERALTAYLEGEDLMEALVALQPMIHVEDMASSTALYEALGAEVLHGSRDGDFVVLTLGASQFSLLAHPANPAQIEGTVEMNFQAIAPLEQIAEMLRGAGIEDVPTPTDEAFGRQLQVHTRDGLLLKINELQTDLYT